MGKSPFTNMQAAKLSAAQDPYLTGRNVKYEGKDKEGNPIIVSPGDEATYILRIDEYAMKATRKGRDYSEASFTIMASDGEPGDGSNRVGTRAKHQVFVDSDYFKSDSARFMASAVNADPATLADAEYERAVSQEQPLCERYVQARVRVQAARKREGYFTKVTFNPIDVVLGDDGAIVSFAPPEVDEVEAAVRRAQQRG